MGTEKSIVLFESADGSVELPVMLDPEREDVWLSRAQLATLFGRDVKTIGKHVASALREELAGSENRVVAKFATTARDGKTYQVEHYNLDMVLSVGYRVKSARGVEFRRWATDVLRRYIVAGHAENERRLEQLGQVARIMARVPESLESRQILDIVQSYTGALDLLDDYDHLSVTAPEGTPSTREITYEECREVIDSLRFGGDSTLFGVEKDASFRGAIGNVFQNFDGHDLYPTLEEKAAHLLYFVVKDHSFLDGNKRIAAAVFLYFLDRNDALFTSTGEKAIDDSALVAMTILIAESKPEEKDVTRRKRGRVFFSQGKRDRPRRRPVPFPLREITRPLFGVERGEARGETLGHVLHVAAGTKRHIHLAATAAQDVRTGGKVLLHVAKRQARALLLLPHREVRVAPGTVRRVRTQPFDPALVPDRTREARARRKARLPHERVECEEPAERVAAHGVRAGRRVKRIGERGERLVRAPAKVLLARAQRRSGPRRERIAPVGHRHAHHA